ncbi:MAG: hypothetical protein LBG60_14860 [Bifidobacteriaceae bacterium]|nr:hypothetical protein [Bifidobacteriaceae bacterium]
MKRRAVIGKIRLAAKAGGLAYVEVELTRHTSISVGGSAHTLGRHSEIAELAARKFWEQFADVLGKGWWRK